MRDAAHRGPRGRGRPARHYLLTDAGRARFGHGYDDLAVSALRYLAAHAGEQAVDGFAAQRIDDLLGPAAAQVRVRRRAAGPGRRARRGAGRPGVRRADPRGRQPAATGACTLCQHHCPIAHVADRVPAAVRGRDPRLRRAARHARAAPGHHRTRRRRVHHTRPARGSRTPRAVTDPPLAGPRALRARWPTGGRIDAPTTTRRPRRNDREAVRMTTAPEVNAPDKGGSLTQEETLATLGRYDFGWSDPDVAGSSARRGLSADVVADISRLKNEPAWMLEFRLKALGLFEKKPMPRWGADLSGIDFDNIKYFVRSTEKQATSWDDLPADIKNTYDRLGIPEAEKARLVSGVAAQYESEVVYHQIREDLEQQGVIFLDTDTAPARAPGAVPGVLRLGDPERRQQVLGAELGRVVGRVVHLRAAGRARRHPAAGLLPDQHREHGPVRAHADHRRRGRVRALRRGLHRADLQVGLAALRGGRDHREEGRPLPLHDHPELVEQRLQPGHQAGEGLRGRDHGVGRRQPRLQGHDEVPGRAAHGRARQGRGAVDRVRRRGPAPGRRARR